MASTVVQFRVPEESVRFLKERGINPNEAARAAFEAFCRRTKAGENYADLSKFVRSHRIRLTKSPADIIREERDSH